MLLRSVATSMLANSSRHCVSSAALFSVPCRFTRAFRYPKVTYLPFDWDYPPKWNLIARGGDRKLDLGLEEEILRQPKMPFSQMPEIENAPEPVKRLLSIKFGTQMEQRNSLKDEFVGRVRRHPFDTESIEYRIADKTFVIRALLQYYRERCPRNRPLKGRITDMMQSRNRLLKLLGRMHQEKYEFVKKMLEIDHTPSPLERILQRPTRKSELRRLTAEYADKIIQEKKNAYHEKLKALQKEFEIEKRETEAFIAKEIEELQLTPEEIESLEYKGFLESTNACN